MSANIQTEEAGKFANISEPYDPFKNSQIVAFVYITEGAIHAPRGGGRSQSRPQGGHPRHPIIDSTQLALISRSRRINMSACTAEESHARVKAQTLRPFPPAQSGDRAVVRPGPAPRCFRICLRADSTANYSKLRFAMGS